MNWTGGRLPRHSKADANAIVKSQKQHFAKARLQSACIYHPGSPSFSILRNGQPHVALRSLSPQFCSPSSHHDPALKASGPVVSPKCLSIDHRPTKQEERRTYSTSGETTIPVPPIPAHPNDLGLPSYKTSCVPQQKKYKTIDNIRDSLLRKTDWVGLTISRPKGTAPRFERMESFGRHRRLQGRSRVIASSNRNTKAAHVRVHRDNLGVKRMHYVANAEDLSFRTGSKIHQTQTTYINGLTSSIPGGLKVSPRSNILHSHPRIANGAHLAVQNSDERIGSGDMYFESAFDQALAENNGLDQGLLPLDKALYYQNFDQISKRLQSRVLSRGSLIPEDGGNSAMQLSIPSYSLRTSRTSSSCGSSHLRDFSPAAANWDYSQVSSADYGRRPRPLTNSDHLSAPHLLSESQKENMYECHSDSLEHSDPTQVHDNQTQLSNIFTIDEQVRLAQNDLSTSSPKRSRAPGFYSACENAPSVPTDELMLSSKQSNVNPGPSKRGVDFHPNGTAHSVVSANPIVCTQIFHVNDLPTAAMANADMNLDLELDWRPAWATKISKPTAIQNFPSPEAMFPLEAANTSSPMPSDIDERYQMSSSTSSAHPASTRDNDEVWMRNLCPADSQDSQGYFGFRCPPILSSNYNAGLSSQYLPSQRSIITPDRTDTLLKQDYASEMAFKSANLTWFTPSDRSSGQPEQGIPPQLCSRDNFLESSMVDLLPYDNASELDQTSSTSGYIYRKLSLKQGGRRGTRPRSKLPSKRTASRSFGQSFMTSGHNVPMPLNQVSNMDSGPKHALWGIESTHMFTASTPN